MPSKDIVAFIKFGSEKNIRDLIENGTIYCNTIEFFRKVEDQSLRGDRYEGTHKITNYPPDTEITFKFAEGTIVKGIAKNLHLREFYTEIHGNIYCLYSVTEEGVFTAKTFLIDPRNKDFGSHLLIIYECSAFIHRLIDALNQEKRDFETGLIEYYDRKAINGQVSLFNKPLEYAYQREFRVIIFNEGAVPVKIQLGSLSDVAMIWETKNLDQLAWEYKSKE